MKKRIIAVIITAVIASFALAACGGGSNNNGGGNNGGSSKGGTYDVGAFTVEVPSGWTAFPQTDIFGEKDENGDSPIDPEQIVIAKASDELSALTEGNVRIYYHQPNAIIFDSSSMYDDVKDIEGVTINGIECKAFEGESIGYVYQFITYEPGDAIYEINILASIDGKDTGITWDSPEVKTILESLKAK